MRTRLTNRCGHSPAQPLPQIPRQPWGLLHRPRRAQACSTLVALAIIRCSCSIGSAMLTLLRSGNVLSANCWRAVSEPVVTQYRNWKADFKSANRISANKLLLSCITQLQAPVRQAAERRAAQLASFSHQAGTWSKPGRVIANVEWHPGEQSPRSGSS